MPMPEQEAQHPGPRDKYPDLPSLKVPAAPPPLPGLPTVIASPLGRTRRWVPSAHPGLCPPAVPGHRQCLSLPPPSVQRRGRCSSLRSCRWALQVAQGASSPPGLEASPTPPALTPCHAAWGKDPQPGAGQRTAASPGLSPKSPSLAAVGPRARYWARAVLPAGGRAAGLSMCLSAARGVNRGCIERGGPSSGPRPGHGRVREGRLLAPGPRCGRGWTPRGGSTHSVLPGPPSIALGRAPGTPARCTGPRRGCRDPSTCPEHRHGTPGPLGRRHGTPPDHGHGGNHPPWARSGGPPRPWTLRPPRLRRARP